jgi:poly-gamma-glutamate synthesis protein (capsule biosynthesis protein)
MTSLEESSDVQIAFIHWGDEYVRVHNAEQQALAHALVDHGIDAVIGHHPHVMQDVEKYGGVPIFYSLGNLVFDQYFSDDVQEGYMLSLSISKRDITYTLHPYESRTHRSSPRLMEGDTRTDVLYELLTKNYFTEEEIQSGTFSLSRS